MPQLIYTSDGAPTSTPAGVGYINVDETNDRIYFSTGTSSSSDWDLMPVNLSEIAVDADLNFGGNYKAINLKGLDFQTFAESTISSGVIAPTQSLVSVDTEADASADDLDTITVATDLNCLFLKMENSARVPTLKHGTGNLSLPNGADVVMVADVVYTFLYDGSNWLLAFDPAGVAVSFPVADGTPLIKGSIDDTKKVRFEADTNTPTATTIVVTTPTADLDMDNLVQNGGTGTDNAIPRYDGDGQTLQNSSLLIDDSDNITGLNKLDLNDHIDMIEIAAPSTPATNRHSLYFDTSDGALKSKDDTGTVSTYNGGDVTGPASATDNGLVTFDSTTGKLIQDNTGVTVSDSGAFSGVESLTLNEISTPSTPSSGKHVSYFDADNDMVMLDDTGDERFHQGTAFQENNFTYVANPRGASFRKDSAATGAIKITLPFTTWPSDMIDFDLRIFGYVGKAQEYHNIGGFCSSGSGGTWANNPRAKTIAGTSRRIRFGIDGTNLCIVVGETTDTWSFPHINVENLRLHYSSPVLDDWKSGWDITLETDVTTGYTYTGDLYSKHANTSDLTNYLPTGTTETIDWSKGEIQELDLNSATGTVTLTFSNPIEGQNYYLKIIQGSTSRNVTLPSTVLTPGGTAPTTITVTASNDAIDTIRMVYDGTNYLAEINQNYG